jgi:hypothetical protein
MCGTISKFSPAGTAELSPGRKSWVGFGRTTSPAGTAGNRPRRNPGQPSAVPAGLIISHEVPRTASWAKFSQGYPNQGKQYLREKQTKPKISPLRNPGFPVDIGGVGELHAAFLTESRTRCRFQCSVAGNPGTLRSHGTPGQAR